MKRILASILGTIAGMSALLSFKTHSVASTNLSLPGASLPGAAAAPGATAPAAPDGARNAPARATSGAATSSGAPHPRRHPDASTSTPAAGKASASKSTTASSGRHAGNGSGAQQPAPTTHAASASPTQHSSAPTPAPKTSSSAPPPAPKTSSPPPPVSHTYAGQAVRTRYGTVQVQVVMTGSTISNVSFLQLTASDSRSQQINQHAGPILLQETLSAQSANIDTVSGATYTSNGYIQSLQSALNQA